MQIIRFSNININYVIKGAKVRSATPPYANSNANTSISASPVNKRNLNVDILLNKRYHFVPPLM